MPPQRGSRQPSVCWTGLAPEAAAGRGRPPLSRPRSPGAPTGAPGAEAVGEPVAVRRDCVQAADAVDMALHDVAAQTVAELERPLDVQATAERQPAERRARERLRRDVGHEPRPRAAHDGQAGAVDRDALAEGKPRERPRRGDRETRPGTARLAPLEAARRLDDAGEHALDDRLRAGEEAPEPRLALARRQRFELAAVEPDAPARRTLVDGHVLIRDGREGLGATRTAESGGRPLPVAGGTRQ